MAVATDLDLTTGLAGNRALGPRPWHRRREDSANPFTVSPGTTRLYGLVALLLSVALSCIPLVRDRAATALPYEVFLRVGAVFSLAFLPAWLFLRFVRGRSASLWNEFVLNLHRLGIDDPQHLPEPLRGSIYHERWVNASRRKDRDRLPTRVTTEPTIYEQKFEAVYGKGTAHRGGQGRIKIDTFFPVLLCTAVMAAGWVAVLVRWGARNPANPGTEGVLAFAFMGAYVFSVQMLVRRYFQSDLRASAYLNAVIRVFTALIVAVVVCRTGVADLLPGDWSPTQNLAIAFGIGFLPIAGLQALTKLVSAGLRQATHLPALTNDYPLGDLDGLNIWYEARLLEEGIEDMQNLATANLVDVMVRTRVPVGRLVDWVDQAHLYLHLARPERNRTGAWKDGDRAKFRRLGIRTATDLEEAMLHGPAAGITEGAPDGNDELARAVAGVCREGDVSVAATVLRTLAREPNLRYVRNWRADWREVPR
jgi:hypothetical protein